MLTGMVMEVPVGMKAALRRRLKEEEKSREQEGALNNPSHRQANLSITRVGQATIESSCSSYANRSKQQCKHACPVSRAVLIALEIQAQCTGVKHVGVQTHQSNPNRHRV